MRREIRVGPMTSACIATIVTYGLWFFLASSQRVRYVLPIYPVLLIIVSVAAVRFSERARLVRPVAAALVVTCLIQMMGQALFTARYVKFAVTNQDREAFYTAGVGRYAVVKWVNNHLEREAVVITPFRDMMFLLKPKVFQAHPFNQALVDVLPNRDDPRRFVRQVRALGVTHAVADMAVTDGYDASYSRMMAAAVTARCFVVIAEIKAEARASRTLPTMGKRQELITILERSDRNCRW